MVVERVSDPPCYVGMVADRRAYGATPLMGLLHPFYPCSSMHHLVANFQGPPKPWSFNVTSWPCSWTSSPFKRLNKRCRLKAETKGKRARIDERSMETNGCPRWNNASRARHLWVTSGEKNKASRSLEEFLLRIFPHYYLCGLIGSHASCVYFSFLDFRHDVNAYRWWDNSHPKKSWDILYRKIGSLGGKWLACQLVDCYGLSIRQIVYILLYLNHPSHLKNATGHSYITRSNMFLLPRRWKRHHMHGSYECSNHGVLRLYTLGCEIRLLSQISTLILLTSLHSSSSVNKAKSLTSLPTIGNFRKEIWQWYLS